MGWFFVSILLPLLAPFVAAAVFKAVPLPVPSYLMAPFKDGQLCWGAIGFCASALYEIDIPPEHGPLITQAVKGWVTGWITTLLVIAALLAAAGATFATPLPKPAGVAWFRHFVCFTFSLVVTVSAAIAYTVLHFGLLGP